MLRLRNTAVYRNRGILSDDILFIRQTQASMRFFICSMCVCFMSGYRYISTTVPPMGLKVCTMLELRPGRVFSRFGGDIFRGL